MRFPWGSDWFEAHALAFISGLIGMTGAVLIGSFLVTYTIVLANQSCSTYCLGYLFLLPGLLFSGGPFLLGAVFAFRASGIWKVPMSGPGAALFMIPSAAAYGLGVLFNQEPPTASGDFRPPISFAFALPAIATALASIVLFMIGRTYAGRPKSRI